MAFSIGLADCTHLFDALVYPNHVLLPYDSASLQYSLLPLVHFSPTLLKFLQASFEADTLGECVSCVQIRDLKFNATVITNLLMESQPPVLQLQM